LKDDRVFYSWVVRSDFIRVVVRVVNLYIH